MKCWLFVLILFTTFYIVDAQKVSDIKNDKDCLNFIHRSSNNWNDFRFDTSFDRYYKKGLGNNWVHKNWGIVDLNNDNIPDLYFSGQDGNYKYPSNIAAIYLSQPKGKYELFYLMRENDMNHYDPLIVSKKIDNRNVLCVYLFNGNMRGYIGETDSLFDVRHSSPIYSRWADTLVYSDGAIINYNQTPSKIIFDSLKFSYHFGWFRNDFEFIMNKNNASSLLCSPCTHNDSDLLNIYLDESTSKKIAKLIYSMDTNTIRLNYIIYASDLNSTNLLLYAKGKSTHISDRGTESNFTLMKLYKIFYRIWADAQPEDAQ
jgi:hypothetical protein